MLKEAQKPLSSSCLTAFREKYRRETLSSGRNLRLMPKSAAPSSSAAASMPSAI